MIAVVTIARVLRVTTRAHLQLAASNRSLARNWPSGRPIRICRPIPPNRQQPGRLRSWPKRLATIHTNRTPRIETIKHTIRMSRMTRPLPMPLKSQRISPRPLHHASRMNRAIAKIATMRMNPDLSLNRRPVTKFKTRTKV